MEQTTFKDYQPKNGSNYIKIVQRC